MSLIRTGRWRCSMCSGRSSGKRRPESADANCRSRLRILRANERVPRRRGTTTSDEQAMEARLADASTRIDEIESRAHEARDDTRIRVERRIDVLRAQEGWVRSMMRPVAESDVEPLDRTSAQLNGELDKMDIELAIAEAQLDLDAASDGAAFEAAVGRQIEAFRAYVALLERGGAGAVAESPPVRPAAAAESVRAATATALERLRRYRELSSEVSDSLRAGVLAALDDLDRAAAKARSTRDG